MKYNRVYEDYQTEDGSKQLKMIGYSGGCGCCEEREELSKESTIEYIKDLEEELASMKRFLLTIT